MGCGSSAGKEKEAKDPQKTAPGNNSVVAPLSTEKAAESANNMKSKAGENLNEKKDSVAQNLHEKKDQASKAIDSKDIQKDTPKQVPKDVLKEAPKEVLGKIQKPKPVYEPPKNLQLFVILGSPHIGKSSQAMKLVHTNSFIHIVPSELIHQEVEKKSKLGLEIEQQQKKNQPVPATTVISLIEARLKEITQKSSMDRVVLEDFPNNKEELNLFIDKKITAISTLKAVLFLTSTELHCTSRLLMHKTMTESSIPEDKKEAKAKELLQSYNQALKPVLEHYEANWKLHRIESNQTIPRVFRQILKTLVSERTLRLNSDQKPDIIYVIGGPSSGKTTQCNRIRAKFKVYYLFIGDLLREEIKNNTPEALELKEILSQGKLVPSDYPVRLLKPKIAEIALSSRLKQSILIDGFPFALDYIETWNKYGLPDICEEKALLYLECTDDTLKKRNKERSQVSNSMSGSVINSSTEDILSKRLQNYRSQMKPLTNHFDKANQTARVNGDRTMDEVYNDVEEILMPKVRLPLAKRPNILFMFGGPGAGKGTHCTKLSTNHGFVYFSTKKLLEDEAKQTGELGIKVKGHLDKKEEVADNLIVDVIRQNIIEQWGKVKSGGKRLGFIIDGFPKTIGHIDAWNQGDMELVGKIKTMINLDSSNEVLLSRIKKAPPKDYKDLSDDQILEKINAYKKGISAVVDHYTKKGLLHLVDADGSTENNYQEIEELLRQEKYI